MASAEGAAVSFDLRELDAVRNNVLSVAVLSAEKRGQLLKSIGVEMETQTQDRFDTKLDPSGNKWADIADATKKYYARKGWLGKHSTLLLEGDLRDSITSEVQGGNWSVLVGAAKEYAAVHQFGWPAKNIPARPYLGVSTEDAKEIEGIVRGFLARSFK
jgi:phage virion morphogenesis protein